MSRLIKNKHGWIRIVEASVAILIIIGVVLVILDKGYIQRDDASEQIYETENLILRDIQNNNTLRDAVLNPGISPPINDSEAGFPISIINKVNNEKPNYLDCIIKRDNQ